MIVNFKESAEGERFSSVTSTRMPGLSPSVDATTEPVGAAAGAAAGAAEEAGAAVGSAGAAVGTTATRSAVGARVAAGGGVAATCSFLWQPVATSSTPERRKKAERTFLEMALMESPIVLVFPDRIRSPIFKSRGA